MDCSAFMLTLLSDNHLFFNEDEIAWDGERHSLAGMQVNLAQVDELVSFIGAHTDFSSIEETVRYFVEFVSRAEYDEGLRVSREMIAPGIQKALREGDMTGITFMNLAACGAAMRVKMSDKDDHYTFIYDTRLALGIPQFFNLAARLMCDLRSPLRSKRDVPFEIQFLGARNVDADEYLADVSEPVAGAQENPGTMMVTDPPEVVLPR